jgi:hypothetical protein
MNGGRPGREQIMTALFNALQAGLQFVFTANTSIGSNVLASPSSIAGLFLGLPVFGPGIPGGAIISQLSPLTLTDLAGNATPATLAGTAVSLTSGFLTFSRRFQFARQVSEQPALYLREPRERLAYKNISLQEQTMFVEVWMYTKAGQNPDIAPTIAINSMLDALQAVFAPDLPGTNRFTLGNLVFWCRLSGDVDKDPGDVSNQSIVVADVEIIVP